MFETTNQIPSGVIKRGYLEIPNFDTWRFWRFWLEKIYKWWIFQHAIFDYQRLSSSLDWIVRQRFWKGNHAEPIPKQSGVPGNSHEILRSTNSGSWSCSSSQRVHDVHVIISWDHHLRIENTTASQLYSSASASKWWEEAILGITMRRNQKEGCKLEASRKLTSTLTRCNQLEYISDTSTGHFKWYLQYQPSFVGSIIIWFSKLIVVLNHDNTVV